MMKYTFIIVAFLLVSCHKSEKTKSKTIQIDDTLSLSIDTLVKDSIKSDTIKLIPTKKTKISTPKVEKKEEVWIPDGRAPRLIICNEDGVCDTVIDLLP